MKESLEYVVHKCKANESKYQKILFERYKPIFMRMALRYVNERELAKDVVQDSFVKIFTGINSLKKNGAFESWAKKIVINTSIDAYKERLNRSFLSIDNHNGKAQSPRKSESQIIAKMDHKYLFDLIRSLPKGYRTVFNLYMVDGFSHREIANLLGITVVTSRSQLYKARHYLIDLIEREKVQ